MLWLCMVIFNQKTAYELRISDWSSDVCSSDLARAWTVKGFFTAFMLSIVPGNFSSLVSVEMRDVLANPYMTGLWTINLLYLVDVPVATVGYILKLKPLDAHIRTANPYGKAWVAAPIGRASWRERGCQYV